MQHRNPVLSLILPNRGRSVYLNWTLENLAQIRDPRVEVIIQDNSLPENPPPLLLEIPFELTTSKIFYSIKKISMTLNWFEAAQKAKGDWVAFIGSDDGVITPNLDKLLDFLEQTSMDFVSTHPIFYQYPLPHKEAWADLPMSRVQLWSKKIKYVSLLAALFPQFKLDLPVPYNRGVVRRSVLFEYQQKHNDFLGVSPDDFLGQYISQKIKIGVYLDLPVFIHGGSERSNGYHTKNSVPSNRDAEDFLNDAQKKFKSLLNAYGITCSFALAYEHYTCARSAVGKKSFSSLFDKFFVLWAELFCSDRSHHKQISLWTNFAFLGPGLHRISYRCLRKILSYKNFGRSQPIKNLKMPQQHDSNVVKLSNSFAPIEP